MSGSVAYRERVQVDRYALREEHVAYRQMMNRWELANWPRRSLPVCRFTQRLPLPPLQVRTTIFPPAMFVSIVR